MEAASLMHGVACTLHTQPDTFMQLLELLSGLNRGVTANESDKQKVEQKARELERLNPTRSPLGSEYLSGQWELVYTTSSSILGTSKPPFLRPQGPIYQLIGSSAVCSDAEPVEIEVC